MNYERLDPLGRGYVGSRNGATQSLKPKSCVDFARSCVDFTEIAEVEIVCRFLRDRVSISPRSYVDFALMAQAEIVC